MAGPDPLDDLKTVLVNLTKNLIPGYASPIRDTDPSKLGSMMSDFLATAMTQPLKDKSAARMLGNLAIVVTAQLKNSQALVKQLKEENHSIRQSLAEANERVAELEADETVSDDVEIAIGEDENELRQEKIELRRSLQERDSELLRMRAQLESANDREEESEAVLHKALSEIQDLRSKVKTHTHFRDVGMTQIEDLQNQLAESKEEVHHLQQQQKLEDAEFTEVKSNFKYFQEVSLLNGQSFTHASQEVKRENPSKGGLPGSLTPQSSPPSQVERPIIPRAQEVPIELNRTMASHPSEAPLTPDHSVRPSRRELEKIARNIGHFEPVPDGNHNTTSYLRNIDYFLQELPQISVQDRIYLIKLTSSREVNDFIDRQSSYVLHDYHSLCESLIEEYDQPLCETGLITALEVKQGRQESPQQYHARLRDTYFGRRNEPNMEEDPTFKQLSAQNLHPKTSYHLGVLAFPHTMTSRCLRELAMKGFAKQQTENDRPNLLAITVGNTNLNCDPNDQESVSAQNQTQSEPLTTLKPPKENKEAFPSAAALTLQANTEHSPQCQNPVTIDSITPVIQLVGDLTEKGVAGKFHLPVKLENVLNHEALLDTGADITLMSSSLFDQLKSVARRSNRDVKLQPCSLDIQALSDTGVTLTAMASVRLDIGPMSLVHPVYVTPIGNVPFLLGKDLLNRLRPLIDFKNMCLWTTVREPLPLKAKPCGEIQCCVLKSDDPPYLIRPDPPNMVEMDDKGSQSDNAATDHSWAPNAPYLQGGSNEPHVLPIPPAHMVTDPARSHRHNLARPEPLAQISASLDSISADPDLVSLQSLDPAIHKMFLFLSDPIANPITNNDLQSVSGLEPLFRDHSSLCIEKQLVVYVSVPLTSPRFVVPRSHRGVMLTYAHDSPCSGHKDSKTTYNALRQVAYWPRMQEDVADYVKGCLVCCQFQPAEPTLRTPLRKRGISFPWSNLQIDWVGPLTKSTRGVQIHEAPMGIEGDAGAVRF